MIEPSYVVLDDLTYESFEYFTASLIAIAAEKGIASFVLSGGGTPLDLYRKLGRSTIAKDVPWDKIHFFWGDERLVPPDDPGSNYAAAREALLEPRAIPEQNIHRIKGELPPHEAAADYAARLSVWAAEYDPGAPHPWPRFDIVLLGLGEDGHTASLFPGSPLEVDAPVIAVTADYQGRPAGRVTLTPLAFNDAHLVVFLVAGANKADAVHGTFYVDDPVRYPAQRIRYVDEMNPMWFLDKGAARRLDWRGNRPPR